MPELIALRTARYVPALKDPSDAVEVAAATGNSAQGIQQPSGAVSGAATTRVDTVVDNEEGLTDEALAALVALVNDRFGEGE